MMYRTWKKDFGAFFLGLVEMKFSSELTQNWINSAFEFETEDRYFSLFNKNERNSIYFYIYYFFLVLNLFIWQSMINTYLKGLRYTFVFSQI